MARASIINTSSGAGGGGGFGDPLSSFVPSTADFDADLPILAEKTQMANFDTNVNNLAREDERGFFDKAGSMVEAGYKGARQGLVFGSRERFWRSYRSLGRLFGATSMVDDATRELSILDEDPSRWADADLMSDPVTRDVYNGVASGMASLTFAAPSILAGMVSGGTSFLPVLVAMATQGGTGGLAEYDSFLEQAHNEASYYNPSQTYEQTIAEFGGGALLSAFAEGGAELASEFVGGQMSRKLLMPVAKGVGGERAFRTLSNKFIQNMIVNPLLTDVPSEVATAGAQAKIKQIYGLDNDGVIAEMRNAIGPAIYASLFGGAAHSATTLINEGLTPATMEEFEAKQQELVIKARAERNALFLKNNSDLGKVTAEVLTGARQFQSWQEIDEASAALAVEGLPDLTADEARQLTSAKNMITSDVLREFHAEALQKSEEATAITEMYPTGSADPQFMADFQDFIIGKYEPSDPRLRDAFKGMRDSFISKLENARASGVLPETANDVITALNEARLGVFNPEARKIWRSQKEAELDKVAAAVKEQFPEAVAEAKAIGLEGLKVGDTYMTLSQIRNSDNPEAKAALGTILAKEAGVTKGQLTDERVREAMKWIAKNPNGQSKVIYEMLGVLSEAYTAPDLVTMSNIMSENLVKERMALQNSLDSDTLAVEDAVRRTDSITKISGDLARLEMLQADLLSVSSGTLNAARGQAKNKANAFYSEMSQIQKVAENSDSNVFQLKAALDQLQMKAVKEGMSTSKQVSIIKQNLAVHAQAVKDIIEGIPVGENVNSLTTAHKDTLAAAKSEILKLINDPVLNKQLTDEVKEARSGLRWGIVSEYFYNNILSSPITQVTNLVNQAGHTALSLFERALEPSLIKGSGDVLEKGTGWAALNGIYTGFVSALGSGFDVAVGKKERTFGQKLRTAELVRDFNPNTGNIESTLELETGFAKQITANNVAQAILGKSVAELKADGGLSAIAAVLADGIGVLGKVIRVPGRALEGVDEFQEVLAYSASLASEMHGKELDSRQLQEAKERSKDYARFITFKDPLAGRGSFLDAASKIEELRGKHTILKAAIPFFRIGVNIAHRFATSNPVTGKFTQYYKDAMSSNDVRRIAEADARVVVGSMMTMTAMMAATAGMITGAAPEDPQERELWYAAGNQPYSVKIGDSWFGINRFDPVASYFVAAASLMSVSSDLSNDDLGEGIATLFSAATQATLDKTFFQPMMSFLGLLTNDSAASSRFIEGTMASFMPFVSLRRALSAPMRETVWETEGIINRIQSSVSWGEPDPANKDIGVRRTVLGDPILNSGYKRSEAFGGGALGYAAGVSLPADFTPTQADPIYEELYRLKTQKYSTGMDLNGSISFPVQGGGTTSRKLTVREASRFKELRGLGVLINNVNLKDRLIAVVNSPEYQIIPDEDKARLISKITTQYNKAARYQLVQEFPDITYRRR